MPSSNEGFIGQNTLRAEPISMSNTISPFTEDGFFFLSQEGVLSDSFFHPSVKVSEILWYHSSSLLFQQYNDFKNFPEFFNAKSYCVYFFSIHRPNTLYKMILVLHVSIYAFGVISSDPRDFLIVLSLQQKREREVHRENVFKERLIEIYQKKYFSWKWKEG